MRLIAQLIFVLAIFASPAGAQEWPASAKVQLEAAGARLKAAKTTAQRVVALREIETIAAANPNATGARVTATLISQKATTEAGPGIMLQSMADLAKSGQITDTESFAQLIRPYISSVAKMQKDGTLFPEIAIQADSAIEKLNAAAAKAGLPSVADALSRTTGFDKLGSTIPAVLSRLAKMANLAREAPNLAKMDKEATKTFINNFVGLLPAGANSVLSFPAAGFATDNVAWSNELFGQSTEAIELVPQAIETGTFDQDAFNRIRDRLQQMARTGPWDSRTAKDFLKKLCKQIPVAGAWCDEAFQAAEEIYAGVNCGAISCDCGNISGGLTRGALVVQCKIQEQSLISTCKSSKRITGSCARGAKGPGATH